jgi:2-polyprenyl-6-hydroxyphenyl methylase/3-demethylubiquinone-9 3-methyltransferase
MRPLINPEPLPCKICAGASPPFGVVDFHKSCIEAQGKRLNLSGIPIFYRRCNVCGFLFTDAFDDWSSDAFLRHIYNAQYVDVDPDFVTLRPTANAQMVAGAFGGSRNSISIVDYGGGNGLLASLLLEDNFQAVTYDPFYADSSTLPPGRFDLVTCFEVMEHVPFPDKALAEMTSLLSDQGAILFSTLIQPPTFAQMGLNWWYVGPRNGHVSIHSRDSLIRLFHKEGMQTASFSDAFHIAFRQVPAFASHLVRT